MLQSSGVVRKVTITDILLNHPRHQSTVHIDHGIGSSIKHQGEEGMIMPVLPNYGYFFLLVFMIIIITIILYLSDMPFALNLSILPIREGGTIS